MGTTEPPDSGPLPRVVAAIEEGIGRGDHIGAQLEVVLGDGRSFGVAVGEAAAGVAMTTDTLMPWYSMTKVVTAVTVMQQWERGRLALDEPVATYVPQFATGGKQGVTIRHLLTHTAGLSDDDPVRAPLRAGWTPGERAAYQPRATFDILGDIVARVSGRTWPDVVHEDVFEPLGMADSWVVLPPARHRAYGSRIGVMHNTARSPRPVVDEHAVASPSRSGVGPMRDLARLFAMLLRGGELDGERVLSVPTVEAMVARHRTNMTDETFGAVIDWGLGVMVDSKHYTGAPAPYGYGDHASRRTFGHGGAESSVAFADPERRVAAALVFNGAPGEPRNHRRTQPVVSLLYEDLGLA